VLLDTIGRKPCTISSNFNAIPDVAGDPEAIGGKVWEYQKILYYVNEGHIVPSRIPGVLHSTESSREGIQNACQRPFSLLLTA